MGKRTVMLADQIREVVARYIELRLKDPRIGFVTITDVRLTGDNRDATIFYTVYGSAEEFQETTDALQEAKGQIRTAVGRQLGMKFTPSITFQADAIPESSKVIDDLLAKAKEADEKVAKAAEGKDYAGEADPYKHDDEDADVEDDAE